MVKRLKKINLKNILDYIILIIMMINNKYKMMMN